MKFLADYVSGRGPVVGSQMVPFSLCPHMVEGQGSSLGPLFWQHESCSWEFCPHSIITSSKPLLPTPIGFNILTWTRTQTLDKSTTWPKNVIIELLKYLEKDSPSYQEHNFYTCYVIKSLPELSVQYHLLTHQWNRPSLTTASTTVRGLAGAYRKLGKTHKERAHRTSELTP